MKLATTDLTDAYQDHYQQRGFTHIGTTMVAVGYAPTLTVFPKRPSMLPRNILTKSWRQPTC